MIKLVYCIRKRDDISMDEFYRYWREEHAPLVKSVAAEIGACRYVQSHTVMPDINAMMEQGRGLEPAFEGITEVWWQTEADLERGFGSPEGQAASARLVEDEAKFIDFSRSQVFMTEEHEIF